MLWCSEVLYHEVRFGVVLSGAVRFVVLLCCVELRSGMVWYMHAPLSLLYPTLLASGPIEL